MLAKDYAENVMIVDLVRNDLRARLPAGHRRGRPPVRAEEHPGLVHLVSTVSGQLRPGVRVA